MGGILLFRSNREGTETREVKEFSQSEWMGESR